MFKNYLLSALLIFSSLVPLEAMQVKKKAVTKTQSIRVEVFDGQIMLEPQLALLSKALREKMKTGDTGQGYKMESTCMSQWERLMPLLKELVTLQKTESKSERRQILAQRRIRFSSLSTQELENYLQAAQDCKIAELKQFFQEQLNGREQQKGELQLPAAVAAVTRELLCFCGDKSGAFTCSRCHLQTYCSAGCQKSDELRHKKECVTSCSLCKRAKPTARCELCELQHCSEACKKSEGHQRVCAMRAELNAAYRQARAGNFEDLFQSAISTGTDTLFNALLTLGYITITKGACSYPLALHEACLNNRLAMARTLVDRHMPVTGQDSVGFTPLHQACKAAGAEELVQFLVSRDAPLGVVDSIQGGIPLHDACEKGDTRVVEILLKANRSTKNRQTNQGFTPLLLVCDRGNFELATLLIETYGVDLTAQTVLGRNALHLACRGGSLELVTYLITEKGFDKDALTKNKETPLFFAADAGHASIVRLLLSMGVDKSIVAVNDLDALFMACSQGHLEVVRLFATEGGVDLNTATAGNGANLLHWACARGHLPLVEYLLATGLDLYCTDIHLDTPLMKACKNSQFAVIEALRITYGVVIDDALMRLIPPAQLRTYLQSRKKQEAPEQVVEALPEKLMSSSNVEL